MLTAVDPKPPFGRVDSWLVNFSLLPRHRVMARREKSMGYKDAIAVRHEKVNTILG